MANRAERRRMVSLRRHAGPDLAARPFAVCQPKPGETILLCAHGYGADHCHWFDLGGPVAFVRPDGSRASATLLVVCDPCFQSVGGDGERAATTLIRNDMVWGPDGSPIVREPLLH